MHNEESLNSSENALTIFFSEEIRMSSEVARFYLQWLHDDSSYQSVSGNAFYLDKKGDKILIGNLFDESFIEAEVLKQNVINFITNKIGTESY